MARTQPVQPALYVYVFVYRFLEYCLMKVLDRGKIQAGTLSKVDFVKKLPFVFLAIFTVENKRD